MKGFSSLFQNMNFELSDYDIEIIRQKVDGEIKSGLDFLSTHASKSIVHPSKCAHIDQSTIVTSGAHPLQQVQVRNIHIHSAEIDDDGRKFYSPSTCPFTLLVPDSRNFAHTRHTNDRNLE